jgi:hypothetical protein
MTTMRSVLALIVIIYLVGVGIVLSPTIQSKWSAVSASDLSESVVQELPYALAWPARLARELDASRRGANASLRGSMPPEG